MTLWTPPPLALPQKPPKFRLGYFDPPWRFETWSEEGNDRSASRHYPTMTIKEILALAPIISEWMDDDAIMLCWVIDTMIPEALEFIERCGFTYKTVGFTWVKLNERARSVADVFKGTGYWTRCNPEQCFLATRGRPKRISKNVDQVCISPIREHSRKPWEIRERIPLLAGGPYLEMFARHQSPGWWTWGNQLDLFNEDRPIDADIARYVRAQ